MQQGRRIAQLATFLPSPRPLLSRLLTNYAPATKPFSQLVTLKSLRFKPAASLSARFIEKSALTCPHKVVSSMD